MTAAAKDIIAGRKVFFITPDVSILPKAFCEEYLAKGYECYFVENDKKIPIAKKIDIIVSLFKDVVLLFNIDSEIRGVSWPVLVSNLNEKYHGAIPIGCLYTKRQTKDEKRKIERRYLYDLGLACGCIELEYKKNLNFTIIEKVLYAFQATGRRKNVRAIGNDTCTFAFEYKKRKFSGNLQDISLSHFSFLLPEGELELKEYERVDGISFVVKGCHFSSNAVLFMEREASDGNKLYVFTFIDSSGGSGIDDSVRERVSSVIYQLMHDSCDALLQTLYKAYLDKKAAGEITDDDDDALASEVEKAEGDLIDFDDAEEVEEV